MKQQLTGTAVLTKTWARQLTISHISLHLLHIMYAVLAFHCIDLMVPLTVQAFGISLQHM